MGMSEADFFAQSIILWKRRIEGFSEMHGGAAADEPFTAADLEDLEEEIAAERAQSVAVAA